MKKIIVICADQAEREFLVRLLRALGYEVIGEFETWDAALDQLGHNQLSSVATHCLTDDTTAPSTLLGFNSEPLETLQGRQSPMRLFDKLKRGSGRTGGLHIG